MFRMGHAQITTTQKYLDTLSTPTRRISTPSTASESPRSGRWSLGGLGRKNATGLAAAAGRGGTDADRGLALAGLAKLPAPPSGGSVDGSHPESADGNRADWQRRAADVASDCVER